MRTLVKRMQRTDVTVHGFRYAFGTWAAHNGFSKIISMALGHVDPEALRAFVPSDCFEERRPVMEAWAQFCGTPAPTANPAQ